MRYLLFIALFVSSCTSTESEVKTQQTFAVEPTPAPISVEEIVKLKDDIHSLEEQSQMLSQAYTAAVADSTMHEISLEEAKSFTAFRTASTKEKDIRQAIQNLQNSKKNLKDVVAQLSEVEHNLTTQKSRLKQLSDTQNR